MNRTFIVAGAISAALAIILGAFGAHGLPDILNTPKQIDTWKTASHYHLIHAAALVMLGFASASLDSRALRTAGWLLLVGQILFSFSLYFYVILGFDWLGAVTPLGGLCFIAGWIAVAVAGIKIPRA